MIVKPTYRIDYLGRNITADIAPYLISATYTDNQEGEADTLDVVLDDAAGLWLAAWHPSKGDRLQFYVGYEQLVFAGVFEVDSVEYAAPPAVFTIRAIAAVASKALRTRRFRAFENLSLAEVVNRIAKESGLTVQGDVADIFFERKTQAGKTDMRFLSDLAKETGHLFSLRGDVINFYRIYTIDQGPSVATYGPADLSSISITGKIIGGAGSGKAAYQNPISGRTVTAEAATTGESADEFFSTARVENFKQAEELSRSKSYRKASGEVTARIEAPGDPRLLAGNVITITGMGRLSGVFSVSSSVHTITADGYTTGAELRKVGEVAATLQAINGYGFRTT